MSEPSKSELLKERASQIAQSFEQIKKNPLNLNLLMAHIGVLSLTLDELLRDYSLMIENTENEKN
jgi:hypothetical protein